MGQADKKPLKLVVETAGVEPAPCAECKLKERLELVQLQLRLAMRAATLPPEGDKSCGGRP